MRIVVAASSISKTYRAGILGCQSRVLALRGVDLVVLEGERVAIVGRHGAGKTTLLLCLAGLLRPDRGRVTWAGGHIGPEQPPGVLYCAPRHFSRAAAIGGRSAPTLLFADDPFHGLDAVAQMTVREQLARYHAAGATLVISAPAPTLVEGLATRIVVLADGRVAATIDPTETGRAASLEQRFSDVLALHRRVAEPAP